MKTKRGRYEVGDVVRLRPAKHADEYNVFPTFFAPGEEVEIAEVYTGRGAPTYDAYGTAWHPAGSYQVGLCHADIDCLVGEEGDDDAE